MKHDDINRERPRARAVWITVSSETGRALIGRSWTAAGFVAAVFIAEAATAIAEGKARCGRPSV